MVQDGTRKGMMAEVIHVVVFLGGRGILRCIYIYNMENGSQGWRPSPVEKTEQGSWKKEPGVTWRGVGWFPSIQGPWSSWGPRLVTPGRESNRPVRPGTSGRPSFCRERVGEESPIPFQSR